MLKSKDKEALAIFIDSDIKFCTIEFSDSQIASNRVKFFENLRVKSDILNLVGIKKIDLYDKYIQIELTASCRLFADLTTKPEKIKNRRSLDSSKNERKFGQDLTNLRRPSQAKSPGFGYFQAKFNLNKSSLTNSDTTNHNKRNLQQQDSNHSRPLLKRVKK